VRPTPSLPRAAVVHREGIHVQRQPAAGQHAVVRPLAAQQPLDHCGNMLEQGRRLRVQALAQRRARRQQSDAQRFLEELVAPVVLHRVEVALALHQQPQVLRSTSLLLTPPRTGNARSSAVHCGPSAFR